MNHRTLTIAATIALLGLTSCSAQQRQIIENLTDTPAPTEVVVDNGSTVVTPLPRNEATVTIPCGETGGADCYQPPSPPTTVYTGPLLMQCEDGSFAEQGRCPPRNEQTAPTP